MASGTDIRLPAVTGTFYEDNKEKLLNQLDDYFGSAKKIIADKKIRALIVPHAGFIYSGQTAAWGYKQLPILNNNHFVLIGPSHQYDIKGLVSSGMKYWQTPLGQATHISPLKNDQISIGNDPHNSEHCLEVQLPFLQYLFKDFSITTFLTGYKIEIDKISDYFIKNYSDCVFIISSDLSHYLPEKVAREKDKNTIKAIINGDNNYLSTEDNIACGIMGIRILAAIANKRNWESKMVFYETSATNSEDTDAVVGYTSIIYY